MPRHDPVGTSQLHRQIKSCLVVKGWSASKTASHLGCTRKWVTEVANRNGWPTNPPVYPGGRTEEQIFRAHACGLSTEDLCDLYRQCPRNIKEIIKRHRKAARQSLGLK